MGDAFSDAFSIKSAYFLLENSMRTSFGDVEVSVPRDRKGEFEPQVLKKNQTSISQDIEEKILSMHAKGIETFLLTNAIYCCI